MNEIEVTIYEVPGAKHTAVLDRDTNPTYEEALVAVGVVEDGRAVTVNGSAPISGKSLENCDRVTLAKGAKGNCA